MKKFSLLFVILILAVVATGLIGCAPENPEGTNAKIIIDKNEVVLLVGETATIKAQVIEQGAQVTWSSTNPAVCKVENGIIKAQTAGKAIISASALGETVYCIVEVRTAQESSGAGYNMTLEKYNISLKKMETYQIVANVTDIEDKVVSEGIITYTSSNEQVATVSNEGVITAVENGEAYITVKYTLDDKWVSNKIRVEVIDDYAISIDSFGQIFYIGDEFDLNFSITKNGEPYQCSSENIIVMFSDNTVAKYEDGKVIGLKAGYITLTIILSDVNAKSTYTFAVIDPDAPEINLSAPESIEFVAGYSIDYVVEGATWGTLKYEFDDNRFYYDNGKIYGPSSNASTMLTVKHLESKKSITTTVSCVEFSPCITTASQLLVLSDIKTGSVYLGADIDLSTAEWKMITGYKYLSYYFDVAYLIKELHVPFDGRGHKITIRYDHDFDENVQIGGLFLEIKATASIKNVHIDYEAEYVGVNGVDGTGSQAYKACALTFFNTGIVQDNYVKAVFKADQANGARRAVVIGYFGSYIDRNIVKIERYENNIKQQFNDETLLIGWEKRGDPDLTDNVIIGNFASEYTNKFANADAFYTAWANNEISNQTTYTAWTVDATNKTLKLNGIDIVIDEPSYLPTVAYDTYGGYTWNEIDNAESYNVEIYSGDTLVDTVSVEDTYISISKWMATLNSTSLNSLDGKKLYVRVQAVTTGGVEREFSDKVQLMNAEGTTYKSATVIEVASSIEDIRAAIENGFQSYIVLAQDIILDKTTTNNYVDYDGNVGYVIATSNNGATIDGLGHTYSFEFESNANENQNFAGMFNSVTTYSRVMNLIVKSKIKRPHVTGYFTSPFVYTDGGAKVRNCYFDCEYVNTNGSVTPRLTVIKQVTSTNAEYVNCIYNLRSYNEEGTMYTADGTGNAAWEFANTRLTIKNSVFIKGCTEAGKGFGALLVNENNSTFDYLAGFTTAWNEDTLTAKDTYVSAGWSVDGTTVKLLGNAIN